MTTETNERVCTCGAPATNSKGIARCDGCRKPQPPRVNRKCNECDATFRSQNRATTCNPCKYARSVGSAGKLCPKCDATIDPRAKHCPKCAPRGHTQAVPIGTRYVHPKTGYVDLKTETGWLREHKTVMEQHLGRRLVKGENVHHKNGDRADNRLGNLELWVKPQPSGVRAADMLAWAREVVARYEGTVIDQ